MIHTVLHSMQSLRETAPVAAVKRIMCAILLCLCLATQAWSQLSVSPGIIILGSYGQGYELADTIEVTASGEWTVSTNVDWLRFDTLYADKEMFNQYGDTVTTFSGNGNGCFTVRFFHNSGGLEREGTITVAAGGETETITIMQDWGAIEDGDVRYARRNPHIPFDPSVGVIAKSGDAKYSGEVIIPSTIVHSNRIYNVEYIHTDAFSDCGDLTSVEIPNSVTSIEDYVFASSGITSITIPTSVTEIGQGAFSYCTALTELSIPNSVTILGSDLCRGCTSLTSAKIPAPTHSYNPYSDGRDLVGFNGTFSFWYCPLTTLEVGWNTPPNVYEDYGFGMWVDMFSGNLAGNVASFNYANCTLVVPPGTVELYRAADVWKNFETIIDRGDLSVSAENLFFEADETGDTTVTVTSYIAWTATKDSAWIILNPAEPADNKPGTFTVAVGSTNYGVERTGKVIVSNGTTSDTIYVTQQAKPQMTVSDESLHFAADPTDSQPATITANVAWTVQIDLGPEDEDDWLSVTPLLGAGDGVLTVTAQVNTGGEREGTVTVSSGIADFVITVTQDAAAAPAPRLRVSPESMSFKDNDPEVKTVTVTANVEWRVTVLPANAAWLILTPESPSASGDDDFTVRATYNSGSEREATITVAPTVADIEPKTIRVTQDANGSGIFLHPEILSFGANESTSKPVSVTVDGHYKVTAKDAWLTLDPESPEGDDFGTFYVGAAKNTGQERMGRIAVESEDTSVIYYVKQSAAPYLLLSANTLHFGANSSLVQGVSVTSNANWTVDVDVSWVTLSAKSGTGSDKFYATAIPNAGGEREGRITIRCSGKSYTIHVEQAATQALRFQDGDLYYYTADRNGTTVEVANAEEGGYSGSITIPSTATDPETEKTYDVIRIGDRAFYNSASLTSVDIPASVVEIGDRAFAYCSNLVSVEIPNSVEQIGEWAFSNCTNLASVEIPASVKKIMNGAFSGCSKLNSVKIPSAVTNVACMAFYDCINLTAMHVYWDTPPNVSNINPDFSDYTHCTLYVPYGKKRDYQYAWYWANFVDIIERSATGTDEVTAESAVTVRAEAGRLYVDSPTAETIYVYSFTGKLLHIATKEAGKAGFDLPTREILIVRGSSGWARKLIQ